jgi:hypothetical protein
MNTWEDLVQGNTNVLSPELRPYAQQLLDLNSKIASGENYDTGFNGFMLKAAPLIIASLGTAGIAGALGAGAAAGGLGATDLAGTGGVASMGGGAAAAGTSAGGSMFDLFDPSTWFNTVTSNAGGAVAPPGVGTVDFSSGGLLDAGSNDAFLQSIGIDPSSLNFTGGGSMSDLTGGVLTDAGSTASWTQALSNLPSGWQNLVKSLTSSPGGAQALQSAGGLGGLLKSLGIDTNSILGSGLSLAAREAPGLMALSYANSQGNDMQAIIDQLKGNQSAVVKAATDPLQANIAAGYGDLVQSQGVRGIRGSSFGETDIANYLARTGSALANAGANAAEGSLALQGQLTNTAQQTKNNLYGKAFDILGRGLNPGGWGTNALTTA